LRVIIFTEKHIRKARVTNIIAHPAYYIFALTLPRKKQCRSPSRCIFIQYTRSQDIEALPYLVGSFEFAKFSTPQIRRSFNASIYVCCPLSTR
jgi:hypothetical protein